MMSAGRYLDYYYHCYFLEGLPSILIIRHFKSHPLLEFKFKEKDLNALKY